MANELSHGTQSSTWCPEVKSSVLVTGPLLGPHAHRTRAQIVCTELNLAARRPTEGQARGRPSTHVGECINRWGRGKKKEGKEGRRKRERDRKRELTTLGPDAGRMCRAGFEAAPPGVTCPDGGGGETGSP